MSAGFSRAGAQIHYIIRAANGFFVVFYDQHRVAQIAQLFQRADQPVVIARVQSDARFVQNIKHAAQTRTDLRGQPNALRFAAA